MTMKKFLKWAGIVAATPVLLVAALGALLYVPPIQNWAVQHVARYASEKTGMEISVGHVRLEFPLDLGVEDVKVLQPNDSLPQQKDTIAAIGKAVARVQVLPLLKRQVLVDELSLEQVKMNTVDMIDAARVKGTIGRLALESHGIDLAGETVRLERVHLSNADIDVALPDSVPPDTSQTENKWRIMADSLLIDQSKVRVHMPGNNQHVQADLGRLSARKGTFDLGKGLYELAHIEAADSRLKYDDRTERETSGLDYNHLDLKDLSFAADSIRYQEPKLDVNIRHLAFKEKSGVELTDLHGKVALDDQKLHLADMTMKTPESELTTQMELDLNTFSDVNPGKVRATLHGSFGKQDLMRFMGDMPSAFRKKWPNYPLKIDGVVRGNMQHVQFTGLRVKLPTALNATASGTVENLGDPQRMKADVTLKARTSDLSFVAELLDKDLRREVSIPKNMSFDGNIKVDGQRYGSHFTLKEGNGTIGGSVALDADKMAYTAKLNARQFPLQHFLPRQGLSPFSGAIDAKGVGTDFTSPHTRLDLKAHIEQFRYAGYDLGGITAQATMRDGRMNASIDSHNPLLNGHLALGGITEKGGSMCFTLAGDFKKIDLYRLKVTSEPFIVGACGHVDVCTDRKEYYSVQGILSDIAVENRGQTFRPEETQIDILTRRDTTHAVVNSGDFLLSVDGQGGYERLLKHMQAAYGEVQRQIKEKNIDQVRLREQLPLARLYVTTGRENALARMLKYYGYDFQSATCDMTSSPVTGLNGYLSLDSLVADSICLDTIRLALRSDSTMIRYNGQVCNRVGHPQYTFNALFDGALEGNGTHLSAHLFDADDKLGIGLGIRATMEEGGLRFHSYGQDPVLGYKTFAINDDNYIFLGDDSRVSANVRLVADDGMGVQIYTDDENMDALQDVTVSLHRFDLEKVLAVLPYTPAMSGILNGDYHLIKTNEDMSVSSNMSIDNLVYEHCPMGNLSTEFVYMPKSDGSHFVDGILYDDGRQVATINGTYRSEGDGHLDAKLGLQRLPLSLVNGFIPDQIIGLKGYGEGDLDIKGPLSKPDINGEVFLDSAYLVSVPYGVELRFDDDPVAISNSHLLFENFQMYAHNDSPLIMAGYYDFSDLDHMYLDVKMRARDYQLISAEENPRSEAYGKAFVNFFGSMRGPVESLQMRGRLDVLGSTDMTYVLRDTPLSTGNQMDELVRFTSFNDSTYAAVTRPQLTGLDMDMSINIDENAHIVCALNADHSNYVDLVGGGELRMKYNVADQLQLTGRYTLSNGEMKYSLPVIPLKTFTIQDGSYIEFTGNAMNPTLNITATEQTKASVSNDGETGRTVNFNCGVVITKTLQDMGLQFTIDAPDDMTVHNELQTMSIEERGKLAVTMLTTGMYLADGNTGAFSMNSALSAFLNSQINTISGNALRTLDLSFGMDNTTTATGALHTDYSFKFAKRFWNNRLRVVVGGKVSSGAEIENQNNSFFDNVTFEYRLSQNSNQYLKLYYDRDSYDWLEGDIGEFGAGFMWKRKLQHFKDIFRFKSETTAVPPTVVRKDSIKSTEK